MDPNIRQSIIDRLKQTNNVLVTVKNNPNIDQLAACIGLTLFLNKQGKHATAVFSGEVPAVIEFLKPEDTLEKDTNSLRDFIISLDKSKADKLRYKVEDKVVKIFITPYKTSLSEADLDFSQGDFNVDVVIALGVHTREELDQAIIAHGRILHDATIVSINNNKAADLGALNWSDNKASSLSEMVSGLAEAMQPNSLDAQIATAFLTGIVSETDRFSNTKTTATTMSLSSKLMAAGANQQLVATKLQEGVSSEALPSDTATTVDSAASPAQPAAATENPNANGVIEIDHSDSESQPTELPQPVETEVGGDIHIDEHGVLKPGLQDQAAKADSSKPASRLTLDPPSMGGTLTANAHKEQTPPNIDPLSGHSKSVISPSSGGTLNKKGIDIQPTTTLSDIEQQVGSQHAAASQALPASSGSSDLATSPASSLDDARKAVDMAAQAGVGEGHQSLEPIQAINAQPLDLNLGNQPLPQPAIDTSPANAPIPPQPANAPQPGLGNAGLPPNLVPPNTPLPPERTASSQPPSAPPPAPPPMMPPAL